MDKKYEIIDESKIVKCSCKYVKVFRIRALKDFGSVKKGDLGGWVESEDNLSHKGNCWVYINAMVYGNAKVYGNAYIAGTSIISGYVIVSRDSCVTGNSLIKDDVQITGVAYVGDSYVKGNAVIGGFSRINGATVGNNANINNTSDYLVIGPIGSRNDKTTFYKGIDDIYVHTGCFEGTLKQFEDAVNKTHKDNEKYRNQYLSMIKYVKENLMEE